MPIEIEKEGPHGNLVHVKTLGTGDTVLGNDSMVPIIIMRAVTARQKYPVGVRLDNGNEVLLLDAKYQLIDCKLTYALA